MANNRLDKLLDSIECGDPSVQACNYEMPSPFRSEFKKPSYGFFVERERPKVEEAESTWWNPSTNPVEDIQRFHKQILAEPYRDEDTFPQDKDALLTPPKRERKFIHFSTPTEMERIVDSGEFESGEIKFGTHTVDTDDLISPPVDKEQDRHDFVKDIDTARKLAQRFEV